MYTYSQFILSNYLMKSYSSRESVNSECEVDALNFRSGLDRTSAVLYFCFHYNIKIFLGVMQIGVLWWIGRTLWPVPENKSSKTNAFTTSILFNSTKIHWFRNFNKKWVICTIIYSRFCCGNLKYNRCNNVQCYIINIDWVLNTRLRTCYYFLIYRKTKSWGP